MNENERLEKVEEAGEESLLDLSSLRQFADEINIRSASKGEEGTSSSLSNLHFEADSLILGDLAKDESSAHTQEPVDAEELYKSAVTIIESGKGSANRGIEYLKRSEVPSVLAVNKVDMVNAEQVANTIIAYNNEHNFDAIVPICAKKGEKVDELLAECEKFLSEEEWLFPDDMITDQPERQMVSEIIREKILKTLNKEIPHGTAVVIEEFRDEGSLISIRAEIFCERASHKGIIVGKNGAGLKMIGSYARQDLEKLFGTKVYLNLWVKVKENWRESARTVDNFGYRDEE